MKRVQKTEKFSANNGNETLIDYCYYCKKWYEDCECGKGIANKTGVM